MGDFSYRLRRNGIIQSLKSFLTGDKVTPETLDDIKSYIDALDTQVNPPAANPAISAVTLDKSVVQQGGDLFVSWASGGIIENSGTFRVELYKDDVEFLQLSEANATNSYSYAVPTTLPIGADYKIRVSQTSNSSVFAESGTFEVNAQALDTFSSVTATSAEITNNESTKVKIVFSGDFDLSTVHAEDFIYQNSHARFIYDSLHAGATTYAWPGSGAGTAPTKTDNLDGTFTLTLTIDEHEVPNSTPSVYYFGLVGNMKDSAGKHMPIFQVNVTNNVSAYNGAKAYQVISSSASFADLEAAINTTNKVVAIERGFSVTGGNTLLLRGGIMLTAVGTGNKPRIQVTRVGGNIMQVNPPATGAVDNNRLAGLHLVADGTWGLLFRGCNGFNGVISCRIESLQSVQDSIGLALYFKGSNSQTATEATANTDLVSGRPEGNFCFDSEIIGFDGGCVNNLTETSPKFSYDDGTPGNAEQQFRWQYMGLRNGTAGIPFEIRKNYIKNRASGGTRGDANSMTRGFFNWSIFSNNDIEGWGDDAIDGFNARDAIFEHNRINQGLVNINPSGSGNALKVAGKPNQNLQPDGSNWYNGYTSNVVYRYNTVTSSGGINSSGGSTNPGAGINTNGGLKWTDLGTTVDIGPWAGEAFGKCFIYSNLLRGLKGSLFFGNSPGGDFVITNNLLPAGTDNPNRGGLYWFDFGTTKTGLIFQNNIVEGVVQSSTSGSGDIPGDYNIFLENSPITGYTINTNDINNVGFETIFSKAGQPERGLVLDGSQTIGNGNTTGTELPFNLAASNPMRQTRDLLGNIVSSAGIDIGPMQKAGTASTSEPSNPGGEDSVYVNASERVTLGADFTVINDATLPGGQYIKGPGTNQTAPSTVNRRTAQEATFTVETSAGDFILWVNMRRTGTTDDTVFVAIDDTYYFIITGIGEAINTFAWTKKTQAGGLAAQADDDPVFTLAAGTHTIRIIDREGPDVARVYLTKLGDTPA